MTDPTPTAIETKLRRLLALAQQQDNENEAAVAFAHAQRLATLHGFDLDSIVDPGACPPSEGEPDESAWAVAQIVEETLDEWSRAVAWKVRLSGHVQRANSCKGYYSSERLVSYGQASDLHVVVIMYRSICAAVDRLAREALSGYTGEAARSYGRSFRLGCVSAIGRRLRSQSETVESVRAELAHADYQALARVTTALCRIEAVKSEVDKHTEGLHLRGRGGFSAAGDGYGAGLRAGQSVDLARPARGLS